MHFILSTLAAIGALSTATSAGQGQVQGKPYCTGNCDKTTPEGNEICKFTAKVNLFAGELGYYTFEECGDDVNPTLGLKVGTTYEFVQEDRSNYYHPLGFAYDAKGHHAALKPGIVPPNSSSTCVNTKSCPAPMYYVDGNYVGTYSNNDYLKPVTTDDDNFGLHDYKPLFSHPLPEWVGYGRFSVFLKFDDADFEQDIFYFCHIHHFMVGRIKLLKEQNGQPVLPKDDFPLIEYKYDEPDEFDKTCGTFGLQPFELPNKDNGECPESFLCNVPDDSDIAQFSKCIDAMNCAMMVGMTTNVVDEVSLFIHQMIPHHQNAVNMAKALLKTKKLDCADLTEVDVASSPDCFMETILREIISGQNAQIQTMRGILKAKDYPQVNDCEISLNGSDGDHELKFLR